MRYVGLTVFVHIRTETILIDSNVLKSVVYDDNKPVSAYIQCCNIFI